MESILSENYFTGVNLGTKILMADYTFRNIENICIGDMVLGFNESLDSMDMITLIPTVVTNIYTIETNKTIELNHGFLKTPIILTPKHQVLSKNNRWINADNIKASTPLHMAMVHDDMHIAFTMPFNFQSTKIFTKRKIYNLQTSMQTYIADRLCMHSYH